jgi:hypothetical protein
MNDLIQSLPSLSPTVGITHIWMEESWKVDGETSVMMMTMISSKSPSRQGARIEFLVPNHGFWWWRCSGTLSGKSTEPPMFSGQRIYVGGRGGSRGWLGRPHHPLARPGLARATRWCGALLAPPRLVLWLHVSSGKIGILQYFLGFFLKVGFLHKNKTPGQFCWKQCQSVLVVFKTHKLEEKQ